MTEHSGEHSINPETGKKQEAHVRFFDRWKREWDKALTSIDQADREAKEKLQTLNADVLRRAGFRQTIYGVALTSIQTATAGLGAGVGFVAGALGGGAVGAGIGAIGGGLTIPDLGPGMAAGAVFGGTTGLIAGGWMGGLGGSVAGYYAGVELAGWAYNKFVRKIDPEQLPLTKFDWFVGQVPGLNPPIVGGIRTMFEGFFGLAAQREERQLSAVSAQR